MVFSEQSEPDQIKIGTPEEKEARLLKALNLEKYMPASFRPSRLVSSFKGKPVEDDKTKGSGRCHLKFECSLLKTYWGH
jgi:hypothetical protein